MIRGRMMAPRASMRYELTTRNARTRPAKLTSVLDLILRKRVNAQHGSGNFGDRQISSVPFFSLFSVDAI